MLRPRWRDTGMPSYTNREVTNNDRTRCVLEQSRQQWQLQRQGNGSSSGRSGKSGVAGGEQQFDYPSHPTALGSRQAYMHIQRHDTRRYDQQPPQHHSNAVTRRLTYSGQAVSRTRESEQQNYYTQSMICWSYLAQAADFPRVSGG